MDGFLLMGKYATTRDMGNFLAGLNASTHNTPYDQFQRMSGALHKGKGWLGVTAAYFGWRYGSPPTYGEIERQYIMSRIGYTVGYDYYTSFYGTPYFRGW